MRAVFFFMACVLAMGCTSKSTQTSSSKVDSSAVVKPVDTVKQVELNDSTFLYEPSVSTITGIVCKMAEYRLQHEEDTIPLDTIIAVALQRPISVLVAPGSDSVNDMEESEFGVDTMQLVLPYDQYDGIHQFVGREARLTGTFYHWDNGNQKTPVLLTVQRIVAGSDTPVVKK